MRDEGLANWVACADPTGETCPRCRRREIVYNGNYYCSGLGVACDWSLPRNASKDRVRRLVAGLMLYRNGREKTLYSGPATAYLVGGPGDGLAVPVTIVNGKPSKQSIEVDVSASIVPDPQTTSLGSMPVESYLRSFKAVYTAHAVSAPSTTPSVDEVRWVWVHEDGAPASRRAEDAWKNAAPATTRTAS